MIKKLEKYLIRIQNILNKKYIMRYNLKKLIVYPFHLLYYNSSNYTWKNTYWLGYPVKKCPLDLWIYQEIIFEISPDIIIESGTSKGGTTLFLANLCDLANKGKVISIDIAKEEERPIHNRIQYLTGSSTSKDIKEKVKSLVYKENKVLVILDSEHSKNHVLNELRYYSKFVNKGSYIIVEDSNLNGNPIYPHSGGSSEGPMEAIKEFLKQNNNFIIDKTKEKFLMTFNPNGFLKRIN